MKAHVGGNQAQKNWEIDTDCAVIFSEHFSTSQNDSNWNKLGATSIKYISFIPKMFHLQRCFLQPYSLEKNNLKIAPQSEWGSE